jgi:DNA repair exonuclease SbcCD ATPase subunit
MAFALFGEHRGDSKGLENLINPSASEFRISFEFDLGPDRFRITRDLRRGGRSDRLLSHREVDDRGEGHWFPVAETDKQYGLDRRVERSIGLNYEMFTCSMMLRQGQAEKLLEAKPKQRLEIAAEVADLKSYQLPHKKAEARFRKRESQVELIRAELEGKPNVEPAEFERTEARLYSAELAWTEAFAERDRLARIEVQAEVWRELSSSLDQAAGKPVESASLSIPITLESSSRGGRRKSRYDSDTRHRPSSLTERSGSN